MCCFSGEVRQVSNTRIFARTLGARQFLVYAMRVDAPSELAMVLPLPIAGSPAEDALTFIDLSGYPTFFADLARCFPTLDLRGLVPSRAFAGGGDLKVERVGSFEASFVPRIADFARLDRRFQLPDGVWDLLPGYRGYGFAVFKLRPGEQTVHPMAFSFPTRSPAQAFFPTVHVHDGALHAAAHFDHELYLQRAETPRGWNRGTVPVATTMSLSHLLHGDRTRGIVDRELGVSRLQLQGDLPNQDVWA